MQSIILLIHLMLALAIIGLVLIQRSEGGGLGIGGSGGGMGSFAGAHTASNILTRATAVCAALFFCTSLTMAVMARDGGSDAGALLNRVDKSSAPVESAMEEGNNKASSEQEDASDKDSNGSGAGNAKVPTKPSVPVSE